MKVPEHSYLGMLCVKKHEYENTGKSLRLKQSKACASCHSEAQQIWAKKTLYLKSEKVKAWKRKYNRRPEVREKLNKLKKSESGIAYILNYKKQSLKSAKKIRKELRKSYVKRTLINAGFRKEDITPKLIELKREHIKIKRSIMEARKWQT